MKRASFLILFVLIAQLLEAQILSVTPAFPSQNDTVTVIYDASEGNGALVGYTPVYAHAGLITNQSTSPTDWLKTFCIIIESYPIIEFYLELEEI